MAWLYVLFSGIIEILWVYGLKVANTPLEWVGVILLICFSFFFIIQATKKLPVGTVYAVFTGLGTSGVILLDIFLFKESISPLKLLFFLLIIIGIVGLKLQENSSKEKEEV